MNATIDTMSASERVKGGMPLSGRPVRIIGASLLPRMSDATSAERVRSGPLSPPAASRP
jgi:hypothetical protein